MNTIYRILAIIALFSFAARAADPDPDFLAKASAALKAVQTCVKGDKILAPLATAKIDQGQGSLAIRTNTTESWPDFPAKPHSLARGFGWLRVDVFADLPEDLPCTPFIPPSGCYHGSSYLVVPGTQARILIETATGDPEAHRRLLDLVAKELGKAGVTARPKDPAKVQPTPGPPTVPASRPQSQPVAPAKPPASPPGASVGERLQMAAKRCAEMPDKIRTL